MMRDKASEPLEYVARSLVAPKMTVVVKRVISSTTQELDPLGSVSVLIFDT
jgi:hypothetical protein